MCLFHYTNYDSDWPVYPSPRGRPQLAWVVPVDMGELGASFQAIADTMPQTTTLRLAHRFRDCLLSWLPQELLEDVVSHVQLAARACSDHNGTKTLFVGREHVYPRTNSTSTMRPLSDYGIKSTVTSATAVSWIQSQSLPPKQRRWRQCETWLAILIRRTKMRKAGHCILTHPFGGSIGPACVLRSTPQIRGKLANSLPYTM